MRYATSLHPRHLAAFRNAKTFFRSQRECVRDAMRDTEYTNMEYEKITPSPTLRTTSFVIEETIMDLTE